MKRTRVSYRRREGGVVAPVAPLRPGRGRNGQPLRSQLSCDSPCGNLCIASARTPLTHFFDLMMK